MKGIVMRVKRAKKQFDDALRDLYAESFEWMLHHPEEATKKFDRVYEAYDLLVETRKKRVSWLLFGW